jgi:hypothetical protein
LIPVSVAEALDRRWHNRFGCGQSWWVDEVVVPSELCRNAIGDPEAVLDAAVWLIGHMCEHVGVRDLGGTDVLDVGCGVRFTQAFLNRSLPVRSYVGVDVSSEVGTSSASHLPTRIFSITSSASRAQRRGEPRFDLNCVVTRRTDLTP